MNKFQVGDTVWFFTSFRPTLEQARHYVVTKVRIDGSIEKIKLIKGISAFDVVGSEHYTLFNPEKYRLIKKKQNHPLTGIFA